MKKRMLLILSILLLIAAGCFLPELLMPTRIQSDVALADREPVQIDTESNLDLYARISNIARYRESPEVLGVGFTEVTPDAFGWDSAAMETLYQEQLDALTGVGLLSEETGKALSQAYSQETGSRYTMACYYDPSSGSNFMIAVFNCSIPEDSSSDSYSFLVDILSRKTIGFEVYGYDTYLNSDKEPFTEADMRQQLLRFSDYLGMQPTNALNVWREDYTEYDWMSRLNANLFSVAPSEQVSLLQIRSEYNIYYETGMIYFSLHVDNANRAETADIMRDLDIPVTAPTEYEADAKPAK